MNHPLNPEDEMVPLPELCARALAALEADALEPGAETEAHLRACPACAEARVMLLAQEDAPLPLVPAGYFETLPLRIGRKLPAPKIRRRLPSWLWAAAAAVLMAAGLGGYLAGRATPAPPVLQPVAQQVAPVESPAQDRALPFHDRDEDLAELGGLSPTEMKQLVSSLDAKGKQTSGGPK